jgi:cytochrome P450
MGEVESNEHVLPVSGTRPVGHAVAARTPMPRPAALPLVGALPAMLREQFVALDRWQHELGDVVEVPLGLGKFVMVNSTEVASEMLADKGRVFVRGGPSWESLSTVFGNGLLGSEGELWRERRRMIQPHFHHEGMRKLIGGTAAAIDEVCDHWAGRAKGVLDIETEVPKMTMAIILRVLFGTRLADADYERTANNLTYAIDSVAIGWLSSVLPRWLPLPGRSRFRQTMGEVDAMILRLAEQRRASKRFTDDLLGMLVSLAEDGQLDAKGLRDEAVSLFVAGFETTARSMGFALWEMARRPDLSEAIRKEADEVLGDADEVDLAKIGRLALAEQAFRESLRMYPGALWIPRMANEDETLAGHLIRKGTTTVVSIYNCHRDPKVWDAPNEFRPERHAVASAERKAWMPFGLGQHMCVGMRLAMAEGPLLLSRLVQRFDFAPDRSHPDPIMKMSTGLKTKAGIWIDMRPRSR